jgi:hypothetical protein
VRERQSWLTFVAAIKSASQLEVLVFIRRSAMVFPLYLTFNVLIVNGTSNQVMGCIFTKRPVESPRLKKNIPVSVTKSASLRGGWCFIRRSVMAHQNPRSQEHHLQDQRHVTNVEKNARTKVG